MNAENLIYVNLRVVSKLTPGDRLQCTDSRYFGIDRGYFSFLWRWLKADGRALALERLDDTVNQAAKLRKMPQVATLLTEAATGLQHLVETYHTDPTTVARLEAILVVCKGEEEQAL